LVSDENTAALLKQVAAFLSSIAAKQSEKATLPLVSGGI